ncbi:unnamed protein product [Anisakis simplex]|uniref:Uncharacterized protein n=1 Tax=Anisakis simplex TaxID=6269 RepID=A0A3P6S2B3_ANISI|nr:unnamed protein product [Anisakis simplex]
MLNLAAFITRKTAEYEKAVLETSAVVFMANVLANRVACWEFAVQLTKLYEAFTFYRYDEFSSKWNEMKLSADTPQDLKDSLAKVSELFDRWDAFLGRVDSQLDRVFATHSLDDLADNQSHSLQLTEQTATTTTTVKRRSTLKAFLEDSAYDMTLISVVVSFEHSDCIEHTVRIFEHLHNFHECGCDVLMLTSGSAGKGGGFLKIVGVPFKHIMDEQEAFTRLLKCRQSAVSLAGSKALHKVRYGTFHTVEV